MYIYIYTYIYIYIFIYIYTHIYIYIYIHIHYIYIYIQNHIITTPKKPSIFQPQLLFHRSTRSCSPRTRCAVPPRRAARAPAARPSAARWPRRPGTPPAAPAAEPARRGTHRRRVPLWRWHGDDGDGGRLGEDEVIQYSLFTIYY